MNGEGKAAPFAAARALICAECGKPFAARPGRGAKALYCGRACAAAARRAGRAGRSAPPQRICAECGKPFAARPGRGAKAIYCGRACAAAAQRKRQQRIGRRPPPPLLPPRALICAECGKPFAGPRQARRGRLPLYCGPACALKRRRAAARAAYRARRCGKSGA